MMEIVSRMILPVMQDFLDAQGTDIDSTFYHGMVLQCVINHKPEEAAFFMQRHMALIIERVEKYVQKKNAGEKRRNLTKEKGNIGVQGVQTR